MHTELTRYSKGSAFQFLEADTAEQSGCLVRIYPAEGIGEVFELGNAGLTLGRDSNCDIQLEDDSVSRRHAKIEPCPGGHTLIDLDSTNGVYIGQFRVDRQRLKADDRIRLGNQIFKYLSSDRIESQYHELVYKIMTTDGLTQVANKRYLLEIFERELARCGRTGKPLSLAMIDLDRFKSINDTYGHLAGDEVLAEFARRAKSLLRHDEVLARYGGEEFALVLADAPLAEAHVAAERLREAIASEPFVTERATFSVTVSIGLAETHPAAAERPTAIIARADAQLYAAKQAGRNCCVG